jgi:hypothetical protein
MAQTHKQAAAAVESYYSTDAQVGTHGTNVQVDSHSIREPKQFCRFGLQSFI